MSNLVKTTAIFIYSLLFFISIIAEKYCFIPNTKVPGSNQESLISKIPGESINLILLNRYGEKLVTPVKLLPIFNLRNQIIDINSNIIPTEPGKLKIISEYLQSSRIISLNLTTSVKVFPSHYFW